MQRSRVFRNVTLMLFIGCIKNLYRGGRCDLVRGAGSIFNN